jgi:hypothetical protein
MQNIKTKSVKKINVRSAIVSCAVFLFSVLNGGNVFANTYTPNIFTDPIFTAVNNATGAITAGAGIGSISLRSALKAADNLGGTHTVNLTTGNYILDGTGTYTYAGPVTVTVLQTPLSQWLLRAETGCF